MRQSSCCSVGPLCAIHALVCPSYPFPSPFSFQNNQPGGDPAPNGCDPPWWRQSCCDDGEGWGSLAAPEGADGARAAGAPGSNSASAVGSAHVAPPTSSASASPSSTTPPRPPASPHNIMCSTFSSPVPRWSALSRLVERAEADRRAPVARPQATREPTARSRGRPLDAWCILTRTSSVCSPSTMVPRSGRDGGAAREGRRATRHSSSRSPLPPQSGVPLPKAPASIHVSLVHLQLPRPSVLIIALSQMVLLVEVRYVFNLLWMLPALPTCNKILDKLVKAHRFGFA